MASEDGIGIGGYFDTQGTATAMRGSGHDAPPLSDAVKLKEAAYQSGPLLPIALGRADFHRTLRGWAC
jgi:hypothetical protein